jgi:YHS domain-containing protein
MGDIILAVILSIVLSRAFARLMQGVREGMSDRRGPAVPERGVQMERDPVCGTFVVPSNALSRLEGGRRLYFCSEACRAAYSTAEARRSTRSAGSASSSSGSPGAQSRGNRVEGRTA